MKPDDKKTLGAKLQRLPRRTVLTTLGSASLAGGIFATLDPSTTLASTHPFHASLKPHIPSDPRHSLKQHGISSLYHAHNARYAVGATFNIVSSWSGKVLDVPAFKNDDGTTIQQWTSNGGYNQVWQLVTVSRNSFKVISLSSGKLLEVPASNTADGTQVQIRSDQGTDNQLWQFILAEADGFTFKIACVATGKFLDVTGWNTDDGTPIQQWSDSSGRNQEWHLVPVV